ncbi:Inositol monophosphatase 3 [Hondaea fermentalgiana]|uniref:3'(2'),5'-bisphosphate nucleotidase 1 n=1 Tax=Hondaea fermentalgiana TaxID=2315210 RepID=A0A2R5H1Q9_9STRA|nr:Inositol monophosphatase 3 [Hondaea fermentalgiana]|eukprot:GBG34751.1 Inositol monophosphatase 3 [Hondaea fermentalgiana]
MLVAPIRARSLALRPMPRAALVGQETAPQTVCTAEFWPKRTDASRRAGPTVKLMAAAGGEMGRFGRALQATKLACDQLAPLVRELYKSAGTLNELKADDSVFTVADGLVQDLLTRGLLRNGEGFKAIVGEEDATSTNLQTRPYTVSGLRVPEQLFERIERTRDAVQLLGRELSAAGDASTYSDCTVFIDPIDGTREFSTNLGEQCTILVGFAVGGRPTAGLMYRPIPDPTSWALGCKDEGLFDACLDESASVRTTTSATNSHGLLTSNGHISPFLEQIIKDIAEQNDATAADTSELRVRAGGVGNKLMNLLEHKGMFYIQDRGVSRWDTCAPQAVIEARGGLLVKLSCLLRAGSLESYTYEKTSTNLDLNADFPVELGKYNLRKDADAKGSCADPQAQAAAVNAYSNICGFLALDAKTATDSTQLQSVVDLVRAAAAKASPTFT